MGATITLNSQDKPQLFIPVYPQTFLKFFLLLDVPFTPPINAFHSTPTPLFLSAIL